MADKRVPVDLTVNELAVLHGLVHMAIEKSREAPPPRFALEAIYSVHEKLIALEQEFHIVTPFSFHPDD